MYPRDHVSKVRPGSVLPIYSKITKLAHVNIASYLNSNLY